MGVRLRFGVTGPVSGCQWLLSVIPQLRQLLPSTQMHFPKLLRTASCRGTIPSSYRPEKRWGFFFSKNAEDREVK